MDADLGDAEGVDAAVDGATFDAGTPRDAAAPDDAATDSGSTTATDFVRFPWNGFATGSVHVPAGATVVDHPLRPKFIWDAVAGATNYQLQVDDSCSLSDFRICGFPSPEADVFVSETTHRLAAPLPVSTTQPVGQRYYWRVRSCESPMTCSEWSVVRYLDVGRQVNDFNGDGYADVLVGAVGQANPEMGEGNAFVYLGSPSGPGTTPSLTLDNPTDQSGGQFGFSVASGGDVNGDGYADIIIGAPQQHNPEIREGTAYVYFGGASGPNVTPDVTFDNPTDQTGGGFGVSVAHAGDVQGDGYADLIVGAASQSNPEMFEGNAFLYFGSATGPRPSPDLTLDNPTGNAFGLFGGRVAGAGDLDGNGYADVVVGAHMQSSPETSEGNAFVYLGGPSGPRATPDVTFERNQEDAEFGLPVAGGGDCNSDGFSDVIVAAARLNNPFMSDGTVFIYFGGRTGPDTIPDRILENPTPASFSLVAAADVGDVNNDGFTDVVVGVPYAGFAAIGQAFVYLGGPAGPNDAPESTFNNPGGLGDALFGHAVGGGDVDGDGYADVVVGAPGMFAREEGMVSIFPGSPIGPTEADHVSIGNPSGQANGLFGYSVAP